MPERFLLLVIPVILSLLLSTIEQKLTSAFLFGFMAIYLFNKSTTYKWLVYASISNVIIHLLLVSLPAESIIWPILSLTISFYVGLAILEYGDKHKIFQISAIVLLVILDFLLAYDYCKGTEIVRYWYFPAAVIITIMQIIWGGGGGIAHMVRHRTSLWRSTSALHANSYRKGNH